MQLISIAIGGAAGALCRYGMSNGVHALLGRGFPYGTLAVNLTGSLIMGAVYVMMIERMDISPEWRAGITIGLLWLDLIEKIPLSQYLSSSHAVFSGICSIYLNGSSHRCIYDILYIFD